MPGLGPSCIRVRTGVACGDPHRVRIIIGPGPRVELRYLSLYSPEQYKCPSLLHPSLPPILIPPCFKLHSTHSSHNAASLPPRTPCRIMYVPLPSAPAWKQIQTQTQTKLAYEKTRRCGSLMEILLSLQRTKSHFGSTKAPCHSDLRSSVTCSLSQARTQLQRQK